MQVCLNWGYVLMSAVAHGSQKRALHPTAHQGWEPNFTHTYTHFSICTHTSVVHLGIENKCLLLSCGTIVSLSLTIQYALATIDTFAYWLKSRS